MGTYGSLGEHIRLTFQVSFFIQHLQGTQEAVAGVLTKSKTVTPAGKQTVFFRVIVIQAVQFCLLPANVLVRVVFCLILDQPTDTFPNGNHAADTVFGGNG